MISTSAASVAINIASEFDRRRLVLAPAEGTPLAELVSASDEVAISEAGATEWLPDAELIASISAGFAEDGSSRHDEKLDAFAADIAPAVTQHLNFAKNVVRPVIAELVEAVTADIASLPVDVQYNLNIVKRSLPEPMLSAALADLVAEFKETQYEPLRTYVGLQPKSSDEVIELLATGAADTDEMIATWAAKKGGAFFTAIWDAVFTDAPTEQRFDTLIQDDASGLDVAVVVFLLCKRLYDNPPEGAAMSLVDYNQKIADLRNQSALRITHGYESAERALRSGLLIARVDHKDLTVNADVYAKYLAEGGSDAVLFGSVLSDRPVKFIGDLNERAEEFKSLWEHRNRVLTAKERNNRFVNYKTILRERAEKVIADNMASIFSVTAPEGTEISKDLPAYVQAIAAVEAFCDEVKEPQFKDIWTLATQLVCRTAFFFTDAEKILAGIDQACKDNEGIAIREAALISLIEYVTDWVCDQMQLKRV